MRKPYTRSLVAVIVMVCLLQVLPAAGEDSSATPPPLTVSGLNEVIVIDRLIADRAYANIKAGRPVDQGIDFELLEREMEEYRPELEKVDPVYYGVLRETYERMKAYVTNPDSDFVRAIRQPGSVEFRGRSPLPAAAFADTAGQEQNAQAQPPGRRIGEPMPGTGRAVRELEPFLSGKAKRTLANIRKMPDTAASSRAAKRKALEKEIAAWEKGRDPLEAAVMLDILKGMQAQVRPEGAAQPRIGADVLPTGALPPEMAEEMLEELLDPRGTVPPTEAAKSAAPRR